MNLVLGVNSQQIPLVANTYLGNTSDVKMSAADLEAILERTEDQGADV